MYIFINIVSQVEYYRAVDLFFVVLYERTFYFPSSEKQRNLTGGRLKSVWRITNCFSRTESQLQSERFLSLVNKNVELLDFSRSSIIEENIYRLFLDIAVSLNFLASVRGRYFTTALPLPRKRLCQIDETRAVCDTFRRQSEPKSRRIGGGTPKKSSNLGRLISLIEDVQRGGHFVSYPPSLPGNIDEPENRGGFLLARNSTTKLQRRSSLATWPRDRRETRSMCRAKLFVALVHRREAFTAFLKRNE